MKDIDKPIPYKWSYGWEGHTRDIPIVNRLIKAILESDIQGINYLFAKGASLRESDTETLKTALYIVVGNFSVMKCLVQHGLSRLMVKSQYIETYNECITPNGYTPGLIACAYERGAYDVMELLAQNGFDEFHYYDGFKEGWNIDSHIINQKDERGLKILLENGYKFSKPSQYERFVLNRPQVTRKTLGLDRRRFWDSDNIKNQN